MYPLAKEHFFSQFILLEVKLLILGQSLLASTLAELLTRAMSLPQDFRICA